MFLKALALAALIGSPAIAQTSNGSVTSIASPAISGSWVVANRSVQAQRLAITTASVGGYFMVFDSATVPPDGAVTPVHCRPVAANSGIAMVFPYPARFKNGLVVVFSTTGCYTKTISPTAYFEANPQ